MPFVVSAIIRPYTIPCLTVVLLTTVLISVFVDRIHVCGGNIRWFYFFIIQTRTAQTYAVQPALVFLVPNHRNSLLGKYFGPFPFPKNFRKSPLGFQWNTTSFGSVRWKISGRNGTSEKVVPVPVFPLGRSKWKFLFRLAIFIVCTSSTSQTKWRFLRGNFKRSTIFPNGNSQPKLSEIFRKW